MTMMHLSRSALVLAICLASSAMTSAAQPQPERMRVIVDADTANEVDDLFAIARALVAPEFQVEGLTSALWRHRGTPTSVELSQSLNEKLLDHAGLRDTIPHPQGSEEPASALLLDPSIEDKVVFAYIDGDFRDGKWGPGIYNWKNDIAAVQVIFASSVEYYHMPAPSVSGELVMSRDDVQEHLKSRGALWDFLIDYWETHPRYGTIHRTRMWDVALVQALLRPHLAERIVTGAPIVHAVDRVEQFPDNPRRVTVFSKIDVPGMLADYWDAAQ
jgi:purine nucleosidase